MEITNLPIGKVKPSHDQVSTRSLDVRALTESIKAVGIMNALTVRQIDKATFEIVAGHRRFAAAKAAGLTDVPCVIVPVDADQAQVLRITENMHRVPLTPMQEAEAIQALVNCKWEFPKIAAELGMTAQQVARRARLLSLSKEWRKALTDGKLGTAKWSAAALEFVARYDEEVQGLLFRQMSHWSDPGLDDLKRQVAQFDHSLKSAPWKLDDDSLLPKAGACTSCPKRSSAQPFLFFDDEKAAADIKNDSCLDKACWEKKSEAHFARKVALLEKEHPNLQKVATTYQGAQGRGDVISSSNYNRCTKKDKGAKPAIVVDGNEVGKLLWITTGKSTSSSSGKKKVKGEKTTITDKERAERLINRRNMFIVQNLLEHLGKSKTRPEGLLQLDLYTQLKQALSATIEIGYQHVSGHSRQWEAFAKLAASDIPAIIDQWWKEFTPEIRRSITAYDGAGATRIMSGVRPLVDMLGLDWDELQQKAATAIPDRHGLLEGKKKAPKPEVKPAKSKKVSIPKPGVCRECGCTAPNACVDKHTGETCAWTDDSKTLCTFCRDKDCQASPAKNTKVNKAGKKQRAKQLTPTGVKFMEPLQPSPELAVIVGSDPLPRTEVTKKVWAYIKKHGLQDPKKRSTIHLDDVLKPIVGGGTSINMFRLAQAWAKHLKPVPGAKDAK